MKKSELMKLVGKFGYITTKGEFPKHIPGWIKEVDGAGNVWFKDTDNFPFVFKYNEIVNFEEKSFKMSIV